MRPPPPPTECLRYPVTVGVGVLAVVATVAWHSGADISPLVMNYRIMDGELWRLLTSALPHVDALHLIFNLYWLWVFGSVVEGTFGQLRTAVLYIFFAAGSSAAEYAVFEGGVGLSGVGYGLFGLLWVLSHYDERFRDAVDVQTVGLFVVWFFLCIALTVSGTWAVANVAHGMGAVQGILLGFTLGVRRGKLLFLTGLVGLVVLVFVAATLARPLVNFSNHAGDELAYAAYRELEAGHNEKAAALLEKAVQLDDPQGLWWYNLGIAYHRLDRMEEALEAWRQAVKLEPNSAVNRRTLTEWLAEVAYRKLVAGDEEAAVKLYREALDLDDRNARNWYNLGIAYQRLGRREAATQAYEKATTLAPDDAQYREAAETMKGRSRQR